MPKPAAQLVFGVGSNLGRVECRRAARHSRRKGISKLQNYFNCLLESPLIPDILKATAHLENVQLDERESMLS